MKTYCITCTGYRPEALRICNYYMERQIDQDFEWIVVIDEPLPHKYTPPRADTMIQNDQPTTGAITLVNNLNRALVWLRNNAKAGSLVLIIEDDDWYHPAYTALMKARANELFSDTHLFGEANTKYYNVMYRTGWVNRNDKHASLCSVGFTLPFLPRFQDALDKVEPSKPFIDLELFRANLSTLYKTSLCVGIKGMPGRKGIGGGHRPGAKDHKRDPDLLMLRMWTNDEDAMRYAEYYHRRKEEIEEDAMRYAEYYHRRKEEIEGGLIAVPRGAIDLKMGLKRGQIIEAARQDAREMLQIVSNHRPADKVCAIYRQQGTLPDLSGFAAGTFAHGYHNEWRDVTDARTGSYGEYDLVVIGGALLRHGGLNQQIFDHYRGLNIPVIIVDVDRLRPQCTRTWINGEPWLPPDDKLSRIRMRALDLEYAPIPQGEIILIAGQRPDLDNQLKPAIEAISQASSREICFRPHPNMWGEHLQPKYDVPHDYLSAGFSRLSDESRTSLDVDIAAAWAVVTHSSIVGVQALMKGRPVIASDQIVCPELVTPLEEASRVEDLKRPSWAGMQSFFRRLSYTLWFDEEFRSGECLEFLNKYLEES